VAEIQQHTPFPKNWQIGQDFDPGKNVIKFMGRDYLNVQNRLIWFIRDQRALITAGLAQTAYVIQTELIELDRAQGWAHFKTYVRDVLGNEATMYGSESAKDFPDYIEKASTKSLGRALLLLGYGTAFTAEIDEGSRPVDAPIQARSAPVPTNAPTSRGGAVVTRPTPMPLATAEALATDRQISSIRKLCAALSRPEPDMATLTFAAARELLTQLSQAYSEARQAS
jgi:hypothetical protein